MKGDRATGLVLARWRYVAAVAGLVALPVVAAWHIAGLQVLPDRDRGFAFLQSQGAARTVRVEPIPAYRGVISDRRGEPLAVSTPVVSLWANPQLVAGDDDRLVLLARALGVDAEQLKSRFEQFRHKEFMYLARQLTPDEAGKVLRLDIAGVYGQQEYKRFYPAGEVVAQLVGFTNIDDRGQEGMELAFEQQLAGVPGAKRVIKDLKGRVIKDLELVRSEKSGKNLTLSIDLRLQYLAYRELKAAIGRYQATSGSVVVVDVRTGEVLAMVNQPSYNPNDRGRLDTAAMRNRAVTDVVEPGSLMKPLTAVAALESGKFTPDTVIDTNPGYVRVENKTFVDHNNYGALTLTGILTKSSQVGITKIALELPPENIRDVFERVGLGRDTGTGFPGESVGSLPGKTRWRAIERATFAFGYGLSATPLQLAQAYAVLANNGVYQPVGLLKREAGEGVVPGEQVIDPAVARAVRTMLKNVTLPGGTGTRAAIPAYAVAGKTGTAHKVGAEGYQKSRYISLFAGMVPADNPRLVTVVVVNDPQGGSYFGGLVAAPVFARVTADALRLLNIAPELPSAEQVLARDNKSARGDKT